MMPDLLETFLNVLLLGLAAVTVILIFGTIAIVSLIVLVFGTIDRQARTKPVRERRRFEALYELSCRMYEDPRLTYRLELAETPDGPVVQRSFHDEAGRLRLRHLLRVVGDRKTETIELRGRWRTVRAALTVPVAEASMATFSYYLGELHRHGSWLRFSAPGGWKEARSISTYVH
jgi:hypothetical protein